MTDTTEGQRREFRMFIQSLLRLSGLKERYIEDMTDTDGMALYQDAFTHSSVDAQRNYEWLEILGDATLNKTIVWYVSQRFPILQNPEGVKVIARLKINMVSKKKFSELAQSLGMDRFIRYQEDQLPMHNRMALRSIHEDVFEAFFGATEWLLDRRIEPGAGYGICYAILRVILDQTEISLEYTDLYDAVTRLKETYDMFRTRLGGNLRYDSRKEDYLQHVTLRHVGSGVGLGAGSGGGSWILAQASAPTLDEARQIAAAQGIRALASRGIVRPVPPYYVRIQEWLRANPTCASEKKP